MLFLTSQILLEHHAKEEILFIRNNMLKLLKLFKMVIFKLAMFWIKKLYFNMLVIQDKVHIIMHW